MTENMRIGIVDRNRTEENTHLVKHVCSCGEVTEAEYLRPDEVPNVHQCAKCGNKSFIPRHKIIPDKRVAQPTFFNVETSNRGFDASRTNLSFIYHEDENRLEVIKPNLVRRIVFDWVNRELKVYRNGELEFDYETMDMNSGEFKRAHNHLMKNIDYKEFFEEIAVPNMEFYNFIRIDEVNNRWNNSYSDKRVMYSLIEALKDYEENNPVQILANAGYKNLRNMITPKSRRVWAGININIEETKPHRILGLSKRLASYLKNSNLGSQYDLSTLKKIHDDPEKLKVIYPVLEAINEKYELADFIDNLEDLIYMNRLYNYDTSRLLDFLVDDLPMTQGISSPTEGLHLLRDYADMSTTMKIPFDKYPRSLKREHDVANINHVEYQKKNANESFKTIMEDSSFLIDDSGKKDYSVFLPESSQDLITEGGLLNHCVGSYASRVGRGDTIIAFMRKKDKPTEPLITIEVKNNKVRQARGKYNRGLEKREQKYLQEWAKERRIYY